MERQLHEWYKFLPVLCLEPLTEGVGDQAGTNLLRGSIHEALV